MGYYVELTAAEFEIPENEQVLQVLKDLNHKPGVVKNGGSYAGGKKQKSWFSWLAPDYDQHVTSVYEMFEMLGFDCSLSTDQSTVMLMGYDNKIGQEHLFIEAVAPYVAEGSYLQWRGEDGAEWRYVVEDGGVRAYERANQWQAATS